MKTIQLDNGLTLIVSDETRRYFGAFYRVRIRVACSVPLEFVNDVPPEEQQQLLLTHGTHIPYERILEKMGVPEKELDAAKEHLLAEFERSSLPYLSSPEFPLRYATKVLAERKGRRVFRP